MKKKMLVIIIITLLFLTGCKEKQNNEVKLEEYYLKYNDSEIRLNSDVINLLSSYGLYNNKTKIESSEINGNVYTFDEFEVETYFYNNIEKISSFWLTGDKIKTNEGIKIGDDINKALNVYGKNYDNSNKDIYSYKLKETTLTFITENKKIICIQYLYDPSE